MYRIMFVCHGNICRSPMAEFIFKDMVSRRGIADKFTVASSATSSEEITCARGNPVYPPARRELERHGIDCGNKRAVQLCSKDYCKYDIFAVMDSANLRNAKRILLGDPENKVVRLMSFARETGDIDDPWYSGNFETAYNDIYRGCSALLEQLIKEDSPESRRKEGNLL